MKWRIKFEVQTLNLLDAAMCGRLCVVSGIDHILMNETAKQEAIKNRKLLASGYSVINLKLIIAGIEWVLTWWILS